MIITVLFITIGAILKAYKDITLFHWKESIFSNWNDNYFNPATSNKNKWKNGDIAQGERFWGSSRWFVWITDGWHLAQKLEYSFIFLGILLHNKIKLNIFVKIDFNSYITTILEFICLYTYFTVIFELFYGTIFKRKIKK